MAGARGGDGREIGGSRTETKIAEQSEFGSDTADTDPVEVPREPASSTSPHTRARNGGR
jgi:hypothetical protein